MSSILPATDSNGHRPGARLRAAALAGARRPVNRLAAERAAAELLLALGADPETDGLRETPQRMAAVYSELLTPEAFSLTTFPNDEGYDELIVVGEIPFQSLCMHHLLPFHGVAHVASGAKTVTSALHGLVRDDSRTRAEFLNLAHGSG